MKTGSIFLITALLFCGCARSHKMERVQPILTMAEFESRVESQPGLAVVDFWASWCGPCRKLVPVLEDLAAEYEGQVNFYKVNVDELPELPDSFKVSSVPTIMLFRNGEFRDLITGRAPAQRYREWIDRERADLLKGTNL